ncbi:hypothetical protein [Kosakonia sacchari]|uniref:hypothetical protein n=1 Tax=Kosakonia sacchari TaxID=1158459 RepID=UPI0003F20672|nr:hypothetical protein [Kosakonia sacchari]AHJ77487.1 hypothetical protein C813_09290 [Kosakonia sacchari SP1]
MTNRAKQKKAWGYQCKSEPIKQRDNNDGVLNRQPTILATGNSVKHDSWSFALRLLHDQTRNVTLPESTDQCLPNLPLNSQPYTISFMDIPMLYRPDLAVSPLNWQLFFTSAAAFYPDDPPGRRQKLLLIQTALHPVYWLIKRQPGSAFIRSIFSNQA